MKTLNIFQMDIYYGFVDKKNFVRKREMELVQSSS